MQTQAIHSTVAQAEPAHCDCLQTHSTLSSSAAVPYCAGNGMGCKHREGGSKLQVAIKRCRTSQGTKGLLGQIQSLSRSQRSHSKTQVFTEETYIRSIHGPAFM